MDLAEDKDRIGTIVEYELGPRLGARFIRSQRSAARCAEHVDLYARGKLNIHIRKTYPLNRAADAHREVENGHSRGKVVLTID